MRPAHFDAERRTLLRFMALAPVATWLGCGSPARTSTIAFGGPGGVGGALGHGGVSGAPATGGVAGHEAVGGVAGVASGSAGAGAGAGGSGGVTAGLCVPSDCSVTVEDILGPFYKAGAPERSDLAASLAVQNELVVEGRIMSCDCVTPLAGAVVDVWQADETGVYDSAGYVLRGKVTTDVDGRYEFRSVLPGRYLNGATYRPRHIHYMVSHPSAQTLITQLYFQGDPYLATDPFGDDSLEMPLVEATPGQFHCRFDLVLAAA